MKLKQDILDELDALIRKGKQLDESFKPDRLNRYGSPIPEHEHRAFATSTLATIKRISGEESQYYAMAPKPDSSTRICAARTDPTIIPGLRGALIALRAAVEGDLLVSLESRIRIAVHDDLLQQASDLTETGYHVAAMVLTGGVLEDHLRKMCEHRSLSWSGSGSISKYNENLRTEAYNKATWRRIQSIGDIRNSAAHGEFEDVNEADVQDALSFTSRFLSDYPE